jgi:macrolide-specific efflux system membrane fusion protein
MNINLLPWLLPALLLVWPLSTRAGEIRIESAVVNLIAQAEVPAQEAGLLTKISVREGQRVKQGDLLANCDDRDAQLELVKARIALTHAQELASNDVKLRLARQALKLAQIELTRSEEANKALEKVISPTQIEKLKIDIEKALLEIEQADKELAAARRGVEAAKNELAIAERALERRRVTAPIDGMIVEVRRHEGEWLKPGDAVMRLVRDDRLRAEAFVLADQLPGDLLGRSVQLEVELSGGKAQVYVGKVTFVSPEANPINGQVRLFAEIDNRDGRLRAGSLARLLIK